MLADVALVALIDASHLALFGIAAAPAWPEIALREVGINSVDALDPAGPGIFLARLPRLDAEEIERSDGAVDQRAARLHRGAAQHLAAEVAAAVAHQIFRDPV